MKELVKVANPYSDNELAFDENTGRYYLTLAGCKALFDICPIKSDAVVVRRSKETSRLIYNYIYNHCNTNNRDAVEYLLNYTENGREFLKQVLAIQVEADFTTGMNTLGKLPAINVATGQTLDREQMRINQVCLQAEEEMDNSTYYFGGINILYAGIFPSAVFLAIRG